MCYTFGHRAPRLRLICSSHVTWNMPAPHPAQAISLKDCDVYCYASDMETDPFGECVPALPGLCGVVCRQGSTVWGTVGDCQVIPLPPIQ